MLPKLLETLRVEDYDHRSAAAASTKPPVAMSASPWTRSIRTHLASISRQLYWIAPTAFSLLGKESLAPPAMISCCGNALSFITEGYPSGMVSMTVLLLKPVDVKKSLFERVG